jgi:hypothetical protein
LLGVENGVEDGGDSRADPYLEDDGVHVAVGDVGVLGDADANPRLSPVGQPCRLDDRVPVQAHAPFLHEAATRRGGPAATEWSRFGTLRRSVLRIVGVA